MKDRIKTTNMHTAPLREVSEKTLHNLAEIFKVMSDPTRLKIIFLLSRKKLCVCDIAKVLNVSPSAVSHQLRILRGTRVVKYEKRGKHSYYSLSDEHITRLFEDGLTHVEE